MKLRLDLRLSQKLIMTPQLQQAIKLLQLSRLDLQQTLNQHLMENPLLEEVQAEAEEAEESTIETLAEDNKPAEGSEEAGTAASEGVETQETTEELSPTSWEDYFDSDRRAGDTEFSGGQQEELPSYEQTVVKPMSLEEHLLWQLGLSGISDEEKMVGRILIGNLDDDGYLRTPLEEIATDAGCTLEQVDGALKYVQELDPSGVGARTLSECLVIQLAHLHSDTTEGTRPAGNSLSGSLVEKMVTLHLKDLEKKHYDRISKSCGVTVEEVFQAARVIEGLEPKPGRPYYSENNPVITPDVFVVKNEGEWVVLLNDDGLPRMRITPYYKQMMQSNQGNAEETKTYLDEKLRAAQWVIKSIEQRNRTIVKVVTSIVAYQEKFFEKGIQFLRPLVLKQVAEDIGMHESTISRVTANKYLYCSQGMLELKFFFNTGIQRTDFGAEMLSSVTVKEMIRIMISEEDPKAPLKDEEIAARLKVRQIIIARRTVAKYRSEENIQSANQRKRFF